MNTQARHLIAFSSPIVSFSSHTRNSRQNLLISKITNAQLRPRTTIFPAYEAKSRSSNCPALTQKQSYSSLSCVPLSNVNNSTTNKHVSTLSHITSRQCSSHNKHSTSSKSISAVSSPPPPSPETPHPDGLTRYPCISSPNGVLRGLDWLGTVSFAASGAIVAGYAGMDSLGCTIVGGITATGGGTIRDILLGSFPVFWMAEVEYLWLILATVGGTFLLFDKEHPKEGLCGENGIIFYLSDTVGLGAFAVIGAQNAIRRSLPGVVCVVCGMITATFGGLLRDVLCSKPARIIHSHAELYALTALTGAGCYVVLRHLCFSPVVRISGGVLSAVCMRHWATTHNITLPLASWFNTDSNSNSRSGSCKHTNCVQHGHKQKETGEDSSDLK